MSTLQHTARRLRARLTYANVMSTLAVVLLLGTGTAYAAGSIGSRQVIDNSLRSIDVRNDNLTGTDIKNGTLGTAELSENTPNLLLPRAGYFGSGSQITDTDAGDGMQTVGFSEIGPGNQMVVFAGSAANASGAPVDLDCAITVNNGDNVGTPVDVTVAANSRQTIAITGGRDVFNLSDLVLSCVASQAAAVTVTGHVMFFEAETLP